MRSQRFLWVVGFLLCLFLAPMNFTSAAEEETREKAQLEFLCALASMSSYDDQVNLVVRRRVQEMGWEYSLYQEKNRRADSHLFMMHRELPDSGEGVTILAFRGTDSMKDAEVDVRAHRVPFGGSTPQEFRNFALRTEWGEEQPQVHQGFNDYTDLVLFQMPSKGYGDGDATLGEALAKELRDNPKEKLILTGHSLGGAIAVLAAARLSDLGVHPDQLEVVTFGAPAVGNEAFVRRYGDRFRLTRIVMSGDPVQNLLQSLHGGYTQFPGRVQRKPDPNARRFSHDMIVYLDSELRHFYDLERVPGTKPPTVNFFEFRPAVDAKVFVAMSYDLDEHLAKDDIYMREATQDVIVGRISQPVFGEVSDSATLSEMCGTAKKLGCDYVLIEDFFGERIRDERYQFRLMMEEGLYDLEGNLLEAQSNSTTTKNMTPILATLYVQMAGREDREKALLGKR